MRQKTLIELLQWRAEEQAHRQAYRFFSYGERGDEEWTYAELDRHARRIGGWLQAQRAEEERVVLLYPPGLDFLAAFFGCLYAGAIAVPAYPPRNKRHLPRIQMILQDAQPKFILTNTRAQGKIAAWLDEQTPSNALPITPTDTLPEEAEHLWSAPNVNEDSLAFLQYTSGSTSAPKGVMVSHRNIMENSRLIQHAFQHTEESRGVIWLPPYHDMGLIGGIIQPLFAGFPAMLMSPESFLQQPLRWLQAISRSRATTSGGPNFAYELCLEKIALEERPSLELSSWRIAFNGAEPIRADTMSRFAEAFAPCGFRNEAFFPCYGLAEATLIVTGGDAAAAPVVRPVQRDALTRNQARDAAPDDQAAHPLIGVGRPMPEHALVIAHPETQSACAEGEIGEIWVAGPSVTQGYWHRQEQTEATFHAYRADTGDGPFLRTGDLGCLHQGELFVTGRMKDLIIIRGRNYAPQDIEESVEQRCPTIRQHASAAFSVEIDGTERLVVAAEVERRYQDRRQRQVKVDDDHRKYDNRRHAQEEDEGRFGAAPRFAESFSPEKTITKIRQTVAEQHGLEVSAVVLLKYGTIPRTSSGKIRRNACKEGFLNGTLESIAQYAQTRTATEAAKVSFEQPSFTGLTDMQRRDAILAYLRQIVSATLQFPPESLDIDRPLIALGVDSMNAIELQHRFEEHFGMSMPMTAFLEESCLRSLAQQAALEFERASQRQQPSDNRADIRACQKQAGMPVLPDENDLSANQKALWFLYQFAPDSAAYHVFFSVRVSNALNVEAFRQAFQFLVDRHPSLRTIYRSENGMPKQEILPHLDLPLTYRDASSWDEQRVQAALAEDAYRPFDLERGPALRLLLLRRAADDHLFLFAAHHIGIDMWSLMALMDEFRALYPAYCAAKPVTLPELSSSYADFVRWQKAMLSGETGERLWQYWRQQLDGDLPALDLPTDHPRPSVQKYRGASCGFALTNACAQQLKQMAQASGMTLYMLLLAAFQVLLHKYSGQQEILIGSPTAGRARPEFEGIVGYLVNPVVLRADFSGDPSFHAFLEQTRRVAMEALRHQDFPFQLLVERLQPTRDASRSPIFQAMFVLQRPHRLEQLAPFVLKEPGARVELGGLEFETFSMDHRVASFDLVLVMSESGGTLSGAFEYDCDLFDAATIQRMTGHFQTLLNSILRNPHQPVSMLSMLTEEERRRVLVEWNATGAEFPENACLHHLFEAQVRRTPAATAILYQQTAITYGELNRNANCLAHYLRQIGVKPETLVGICMERSPEMVVAMLGILKAGGAYVPFDPAYPQERLQFMAKDAQIAFLVAPRRLLALFANDAMTPICLDEIQDALKQQSDANPDTPIAPENLAYVIYTSGSTGVPKGVLIAHQGVCNLAHAEIRLFDVRPNDRILQFVSFSFDVSVSDMAMALCSGASLCLNAKDDLLPGPDFLDLLRALRITHLEIPSSVLSALPDAELPDLRVVIVGGDVCARELVTRWVRGRRLFNAYGPTETTVCATVAECDPDDPRPPSLGRPLPNVTAYILDAQLHPVPIGVSGELHLGGVGVARGYLNRPDLTQERFLPHPFRSGAAQGRTDRIYKTGDLARYRATGEIEFLGRIDQQVKIRGFRVELGEIEAALRQHPHVREAVVVPTRRPDGAAQLTAYVTRKHPAASGDLIAALRKFLPDKLPAHAIPAFFVALDAFPFTPNGKIDLRALPEPAASMQRGTPDLSDAPRSRNEMLLAEAWRQVFGGKTIGIHENFFELGGDSILSIQAIARVRQAGLVITAKQMMQYQTIAELAAVAEESRSGDAAEQGILSGDVPLTPAQCWFFERQLAEPQHFNQAVMLNADSRVDVNALRESLRHLLRHHDALRLRFIRRGGEWTQFYAAPDEQMPLTVLDASAIPPEARSQTVISAVTRLNAGLDLADGPIMQMLVVDHGAQQPSQVVWIMHHLVVDGVSWRILVEDLHTAYQSALHALPISLPPKTTSYKHWADALRQHARSADLAAEAAYWEAQREHIPLPVDVEIERAANTVAASGSLAVSLNADETSALLTRIHQAHDTTILEFLLTAFARTLSQWTGQPRVRFDLEGHGREEIGGVDLSRTVGWFTAIFPVILTLPPSEDHDAALQSVAEQLRRVPSHGLGYGILRYLARHDNLRRDDSASGITFNYLGQIDLGMGVSSFLRLSPERIGGTRSPREARDYLLEVNSFAAGGRLHVEWTYPKPCYRQATIERLAAMFLEHLRTLIAHGLTASTQSGDAVAQTRQQPYLQIERRSLFLLAMAGKLAPVQAAAFGYLPASLLQAGRVSRDDLLRDWFDELPVVYRILDTTVGRVAHIMLPRLNTELYNDHDALLESVMDGLHFSQRLGAKMVSLTGLIPSATRYGEDIAAAMASSSDSLPGITTGHATTCASVVVTIKEILAQSGRDITQERMAFLGLGSIGVNTLRLMLASLPHPARLMLCDVYSKRDTLDMLRRQILEEAGFRGDVSVFISHAQMPAELYEASFIVGATNVPDILDIRTVAPGAIIVDDSGPHCFSTEMARARLEERGDILFSEGGFLRSPQPITSVVRLPRHIEQMVPQAQIDEYFLAHDPHHLTGCILSGLLSAQFPDVAPTLGAFIEPSISIHHYRTLEKLGFTAAALHCDAFAIAPERITAFRRRFGRT